MTGKTDFTKIYCLTSRDRDYSKYPDAANYTINLPETINNISKIELISINFDNYFYPQYYQSLSVKPAPAAPSFKLSVSSTKVFSDNLYKLFHSSSVKLSLFLRNLISILLAYFGNS